MKRYLGTGGVVVALLAIAAAFGHLRSREHVERELASRPTGADIDKMVGRRLTRARRAQGHALDDSTPSDPGHVVLRGEVLQDGTAASVGPWKVRPIRAGVYLIVLNTPLPNVPTVLLTPLSEDLEPADTLIAARNVTRQRFDVVVGTLKNGRIVPASRAFSFVLVR